MIVQDLKPAPFNPRQISDKQLEMLSKSMQEFGDLSGIVVNVNTGHIIGGHQRVKVFDPQWPIKKQAYKDGQGTTAIGYIETPFGQWLYREVSWDKEKEAAANIAANKQGGEWDLPKLKDMLIELDSGAFDMEITGFDENELKNLLVDRMPPDNEPDDPNKNLEPQIVTCPKCGHEFSVLRENND